MNLNEALRLRAESRLIEFVNQYWHTLEPSTPFQNGWVMDAIADHLQAIAEGHIRRLLINVPPGCSKSMLTSVFLPAWIWGPRGQPGKRFITTSYAQELAIRDAIRHRDLHVSPEYQANWPIGIKEDENAKLLWANDKGGFRKASSTGAALTGFRADFIIVDDPHSVKGGDSDTIRESALQWFAETLPTRLNDQRTSAIIVIMQRIHMMDVSGLILENELGYTKLVLPMEYEENNKCTTNVTWFSPITNRRELFEDPRTEEGELLFPERFPRDELETLKNTFRSMGSEYAVSAQLQQRPVPRGGGLFKKASFVIVDQPPEDHEIIDACRGWDLAGSKSNRAAYTSGVKLVKLRDGRYCIMDVRRHRKNPHEVRKLLQSTAEEDGIKVVISIPQDPGQAGLSQKTEFAALLDGFRVKFSPESGSKEMRAESFAAQVEAGNVIMVRGRWNDAYLAEASTFPRGEYKDQIDATSRAYSELLKRKTGVVSQTPPELIFPESDSSESD